jgi:hypothetical protein
MTAYAVIGDVTALFDAPPTGARLTRMTALLAKVTDELIEKADGRDYLKHPDSGTASWYVDGEGRDLIHQHAGIVSVSTLEISYDVGQTFVEVPSTGYVLEGSTPRSSEPVDATREPYFHVRLLPWSGYPVFPGGVRTVRLTGVRGWPAVPPVLVEATAERVRQVAFADASYGGNVSSDPAYGTPTSSMRWPDTLYKFLEAEGRRFAGCWL